MIQVGSLVQLLERLAALRFSGKVELRLDRGTIAAVELRQVAPFDLEGLAIVQTEAPAEEPPAIA